MTVPGEENSRHRVCERRLSAQSRHCVKAWRFVAAARQLSFRLAASLGRIEQKAARTKECAEPHPQKPCHSERSEHLFAELRDDAKGLTVRRHTLTEAFERPS